MARIEGKGGIDFSLFRTNTLKDAEKSNMFIYGAKGAGKTTLAATISDHYPEGGMAKTMTELSDMAWLAFDRSPTDCLIPRRCMVSKIIDGTAFADQHGIRTLIHNLEHLIGPILEGAKYLVVDTLSEFDRLLHAHHVKHPPSTKGGGDDLQGMWNYYHADHSEFRAEMRRLVGERRIIWLAHARALGEAQGNRAQAEALKDEAYDRGDIVPDLVGKSAFAYIAESTGESVMKRVPGVGRDPDKYVFLPYGDKNYEGKHRWAMVLDREERPDLKYCIAKVQRIISEAKKEI